MNNSNDSNGRIKRNNRDIVTIVVRTRIVLRVAVQGLQATESWLAAPLHHPQGTQRDCVQFT